MPYKVKEADLHPIRYDTYCEDYEVVHHVRASLLRLPPGTKPTEVDFNNSARYVPRSAASDKKPPEVVTPHWLPFWRNRDVWQTVPPVNLSPPTTGCPCTPQTV